MRNRNENIRHLVVGQLTSYCQLTIGALIKHYRCVAQLCAMVITFSTANAFASPIDSRIASGTYSGGGITLMGDDLRRIAAGDDVAGNPRGGDGGSGRVLLVECNGAYGYATIQSAIDDTVDGDVVVVLPNDCTTEGRWFEKINFLGKAIRVQSAIPQDDAVVDATIVDGNADGTVVTFENGEGLDSVLDGVVVTNGSDGFGGGISIYFSTPTVRRTKIRANNGAGVHAFALGSALFENCLFDGNTGTIASAINAVQSSIPTLIECEFRNHGGEHVIRGRLTPNGGCETYEECTLIESCDFLSNDAGTIVRGDSIIFDDCRFAQNQSAIVRGSFLEFVDCNIDDNVNNLRVTPDFMIAGNSKFNNCTFDRNAFSGTRYLNMPGGGTVIDCRFEDNDVRIYDGIITSFFGSQPTDILIENTIFRDNNIWGGSAINVRDNRHVAIRDCHIEGTLTTAITPGIFLFVGFIESKIDRCTIIGNSTGTLAGGIVSRGNVHIDSCLIVGNTGDEVAAIASLPAGNFDGPRIASCTIAYNHCFCDQQSVDAASIVNSIIYGNRGLNGIGAQLAPGTVANYCNIQNFSGLVTIQNAPMASIGNFDLDPRFVDPGVWDDMGTPDFIFDDVYIPGDYHLMPDSPCIDAGNPEFVPDAGATDIDGEARVQSCRVDIGADEFTQDDIAVPGDFDGDGFVSIADVPEFLSVALGPVGSHVCQGDLTGDSRFDGRDIAALTALLNGN